MENFQEQKEACQLISFLEICLCIVRYLDQRSEIEMQILVLDIQLHGLLACQKLLINCLLYFQRYFINGLDLGLHI